MLNSLVRKLLLLALLAPAVAPASISAQASEAGMLSQLPQLFAPEDPGIRASLEGDFLDQGQNWNGIGPAPSSANLDKDLAAAWLKAGLQFRFDRSWALRTEVPLGIRSLQTVSQGQGTETFTRVGIGDIRVLGEFSGLTADRSTTIRAGLKLPSGSASDPVYGPSYRLGTGSTDLLLGLGYFGPIGSWERWVWTMEFLWRQPLATQNGFIPGGEIDQSFGITYRGLFVGQALVVPVVQLANAYHWSDNQAQNDSVAKNTGYSSSSMVPGIGVEWDAWRAVINLGIPLYQNVNGNQLVAPVVLQSQVSYGF